MTRFYDFYKRVPRYRRKELAKFVHELKKLCGRKFHVHVLEMLENCDEDYVSVDTTKLDFDMEALLQDKVLELMDEYGIPRRNMREECEYYFTDERGFTIALYSDF